VQTRLLTLLGTGAILLGSAVPEFWNAKDPASWTHADAEQMMSSSPWAKQKSMPISERPAVSYVDGDPSVNATSPPSAQLGNLTPARNGTQPTARSSSLASGIDGAPLAQPVLKIIWASAQPVRLAALKLRAQKGEPTAEQFAKVQKDWPNYVIAVVGLAPPEAGSNTKALASGAFLSVHGKPAVVSSDSDYRRIGNSDVYFFRFPKTALPLTLSDEEALFKLTMGKMNLNQKFRLSEMTYQGRLAL
jgi:hypothetical protein